VGTVSAFIGGEGGGGGGGQIYGYEL
jgi:hypothetical protein